MTDDYDRPFKDEAAIERVLDKRVQRRLATDGAYRNAENAEEQAEAERRIEREEWEHILAERYVRDQEEVQR